MGRELAPIELRYQPLRLLRKQLVQLNSMFRLRQVALRTIDQQFNAQRILTLTLLKRFDSLLKRLEKLVRP